jgi:hypothetical protein
VPPKKETPFQGKGTDSVAQLVEQYTFNVRVLGSNPSGITAKSPILEAGWGFFIGLGTAAAGLGKELTAGRLRVKKVRNH